MLSRLKFEIAPLVNEMLDRLPADVWASPTKTFLDQAIGGGQFLVEVNKRLAAAGHSEDNIASRVYGLADTPMSINYARNQNKVLGQLQVGGLETLEEWVMAGRKFDVVIGNPPFQDSSAKDSSAKRKVGNKLWYQFIFMANRLVKEGGYVAMVSPNQWLSGGVQMRRGALGVLKDIFAKKQLVAATVGGVTKEYFRGIGISIGWWIYQNCPITSTTPLNLGTSTIMVDFKDLQFLSPEATEESFGIVSKTLLTANSKFETYYFNGYCKPDLHKETKEATAANAFPHWIMGSNVTDNLVVRYFPKVLNVRVAYKKIVFPMSTRYWQPFLAAADVSVASLGQSLRVDDDTTQVGFESVFYSKLFTYLCFNLQIAQNGFMKTVLVKALPKLDMSRPWTDKELYDHFDLTQEEREYIETTVK